MSSVKVTLAIGIALAIAAIALVLTGSPPRTVRVNQSTTLGSLGITQGELAICQGNETLPADVSAIRISLVAFFGSNLQVGVYQGRRLITQGSRDPDWSGTSATVPVKPLDHAAADVDVCVSFVPNSQLLQLFGQASKTRRTALAYVDKERLTATEPTGEATSLHGTLLIEYLAPGSDSWWSRLTTVADHMGLGHFIAGKWIALLTAALMAAVSALAVRLTLREQP